MSINDTHKAFQGVCLSAQSAGVCHKHQHGSTFLLVRVQDWLSAHLRSRLAASVLLLYVPLTAAGILISAITGIAIFSRGVVISMLWLAIAPFLVQDALRVLTVFFASQKHLFSSESEHGSLRDWTLARFHSPRYVLFGIPWALAATSVIICAKYGDCPWPVITWAGTTYFALFFISAIGFQGILTVVALVVRLGRAGVRFDPYHPDLFGGLEAVSRLSVRGTMYFSTGALVFPLVFELIARHSENSALLEYSTLGITSIFIAVVLYSFLGPVLRIKDMVAERKEQAIVASNSTLDELYEKVSAGTDDGRQYDVFRAYYRVYHCRLYDIKDYPYDTKVLFELLVSIGLPIIMAVFEKFVI
ncbi:MAG: hypothetical protein RBR19_18360 [Sedimentisphaerales bacterium]|nr:hypothetical protein [Sedimentisphaerales bacterium]